MHLWQKIHAVLSCPLRLFLRWKLLLAVKVKPQPAATATDRGFGKKILTA